jgi:hypothetical protein
MYGMEYQQLLHYSHEVAVRSLRRSVQCQETSESEADVRDLIRAQPHCRRVSDERAYKDRKRGRIEMALQKEGSRVIIVSSTET